MASLPFLNSRISLISKSNIRYEGQLHSIDPTESSVALSNVRSFGTEDRKVEKFVPPSNEIYEIIIFRGTDIQDLTVCERPPTQPTMPNDPAIMNATLPQPNYMHYLPPGGQNLFGMPPPYYHPYWNPSYLGQWGQNQIPPTTSETDADPFKKYPRLQPDQVRGKTVPWPQAPPKTVPTTLPRVGAPTVPTTTTGSNKTAAESSTDQVKLKEAESLLQQLQPPSQQQHSQPQVQSQTQAPSTQVSSKSTNNETLASKPQVRPVSVPDGPDKQKLSEATKSEVKVEEKTELPVRNEKLPSHSQPLQRQTKGQRNDTGDNRRSNQRGRGGNYRGRGGQSAPSYRGRGGKGKGGRGQIRPQGDPAPRNDFDWEESTASFDKQKVMKEIEEQRQQLKKEREQVVDAAADVAANLKSRGVNFPHKGTDDKIAEEFKSLIGTDAEAAYLPTVTIFDTLSCDTFDRIQEQKTPMDRKTRQKTLQEQRKLDEETFGAVLNNRQRYNGAVRRRYQPGQNSRDKNNIPGQSPSTNNNNNRNPRGNNMRGKQQKVFRPVQREVKSDSNLSKQGPPATEQTSTPTQQ